MSYHVIDLIAAVQGSSNHAFGINDQHPQGIGAQPWPPVPTQPKPFPVGQVVGVFDAVDRVGAFRRDGDGTFVDVGATAGAVNTWAFAINDAGQAVGWWNSGGVQSQALMWSENLEITAIAPLLSPATEISNAYDINDKGQVIGRARLSGNPRFRGFVFDAGDASVSWIDAPGAAHCFPFGVNASGVVVGQFGNDANVDAPLSSGANRAFRWSPDAGLQPLFRQGTGCANDINDAGVIVGIHFEKDGSGNALPRGAFIRRANGTVFFPADGVGLQGEGLSANAINNHNEVVGSGIRPMGSDVYRYAWIYDRYLYSGNSAGSSSGSYEDLNALIPSDSGWHLIEAYDINNAGQIVGRGRLNGQPKPFLLVPQFVRDDVFRLRAELVARVLGGVAQDGGGVVIKPGGGAPVPPWDPVAALLHGRTREEAAALALRLARDLSADESQRAAIESVLRKSGRRP